ncbi:MAG: RagB/SusD family nutrient uptake outer membrane protein [Bacteroidales bacterium]|nr:RagB/SusD family nutrient uptake outer membrane protein [Bacteroidales bacterium]
MKNIHIHPHAIRKGSLLLTLLLAMLLTACEGFLTREPEGSLQENNAFTSNDNFRAYMYKCYAMFTDRRIATNQSGTQYQQNGQYYSDHYSGLLTDRDLYQNPYAYQTVPIVTSSDTWDFSYIRMVNIMLSHLEDGYLTEAEQEHWRSVGYFFHSWWYMELIARYGDVPYITSVLNDLSPEAYGPRTPRAEVARNIIDRLEYAIAHIGNQNDGDCTVNADCCRAALSRFLLREATWAKYHGLDEDYTSYFEKCMAVSDSLMVRYPDLFYGNGNDHYPAAGFDNEYTTEDLAGVPGIILYKQYNTLLAHRFSDFVHVAAHTTDAPQATIDLYLMQNGRPIANASSGYKGGEGHDLWDVYENRDPRLPITFEPPVQAKIGKFENPDNVNTFVQWTFWSAGDTLNGKGNYAITAADSVKFRRYIDYFGPNIKCYDGGGDPSLGSKRLPAHNHTNSMSHSAPNITKYSQTDNYMRCLTGYYFWKSYTSWEKGLNKAYQTSDKPIFLLSEVLLNYAEAACELGRFNQEVADKTINKLRARAGVEPMTVSLIDDNWDPKRDKGTAPWIANYDSKTTYPVPPLLWEIRRERLVELMGTGMSFYDVKRWHKAPYFINRQPCGAWVTAANLPYGTGAYTGLFVDNNLIEQTGSADPNTSGSGWIYTYPSPLATGGGWLDRYYLDQVPLDQITLNPALGQNPGY